MLKRLRISGRLNLLVFLPLVALVASALIRDFTLRNASVRGDEYRRLKEAQDLVADTNPPPANLLEAWGYVNHIGVLAASRDAWTAESKAAIDADLAIIDAAHTKFVDAMQFWSQQDLPQRVQIRLGEMGGYVGEQFFADVENKLKPAIARENTQSVLSIIRAMQWRFNLQNSGVQRALEWALPEVVAREDSTDEYVGLSILWGDIAVGGIVVISLVFMLVVRRSISKPIRALVDRARSVVDRELPDAVRSLQSSDMPDSDMAHLPPFDPGTKDELAMIAQSFNSLQDVAVDLAGEQAVARRVVSQNLINIARRNQNLLGRTLGFISSLEEGERDPEALDNLFRLDHLTTRMRRNAQSLLVLAGAEPTRLWSPAVAIGDVVRAALSEVENYGQVELAELGDIGVLGSAAGEVAHLLAELLENATSFSPPNSPVTVVGRAVPDGHQLAIFDYGLGMTTEELAEANRRLAEVAAFDRESNKMLGFQVVARLAARYDIKVMLTTTPGGNGVTAIVRLPRTILEVIASPGSGAGQVPTGVADRINEPLSTSVGQARPADSMAGASAAPMAMGSAAPTLAPAAPSMAPAAPMSPMDTALSTTEAGLTRRVRGAQLPDLGSAPVDTGSRPPDEIRNTLASLQRGVDQGRRRSGDS